AYSASGNVTGPVVYVNYGRTEDFEWLKKKKVHVKGAIALIRHGVVPSSLKLYNAELYGCIGALVFIDPSDTDPIEKKTFTSDDDKTIHSWSIPVKRESVEYGFIHPGDPFTPGFAATLNATRLNETTALPQIPSLPISWSDALPLFHTTEGHGETKKSWKGGLSQAKYFTGPSKSMVNLVNINELAMKPVWNVVGQIKGHEEPDKAIVIGSHRDSLGDYADASSGSAVLLELVRVFGILLEKGWRPRRTIVIASWDANEYGNTGSTEWVEDHLHWLSKEAIAYINLDNAITGSRFSAEGSPLLHRLIMEVTAMVVDPRTGVSVYETWLSSSTPTTMDNEDDEDDYLSLIRPPGTSSGLDTLPFFEFAGVSSLSLSFESGGDESDSLWIKEEFQDPLFEYHQTMVKILGLLAFRLSDDILIPLYPVDYTLAMKQHLKELTREPSEDQLSTFKKENKTSHANALPKLAHSLSKLLHTSMQFHEKVEGLENKAVVNKHRSHKLLKHINRANERLVLFERALLNKNGLLMGRPWHKHTIYGPSIQTGLVAPFPAIQEVRALDNSTLLAEVEKSLSHTLENAKRVLQGKRLHSDENDKEDDDNDNHVNFVE
ncbi:Zn-dependent exopeptidase, partial [Backusella circina FSU 941]